jgi:hypothetical protein
VPDNVNVNVETMSPVAEVVVAAVVATMKEVPVSTTLQSWPSWESVKVPPRRFRPVINSVKVVTPVPEAWD